MTPHGENDKGDEGSISWHHADVRDMHALFPDETIDVAFDKGTMDAMIHGSPWDPPDSVLRDTKMYISEVSPATETIIPKH